MDSRTRSSDPLHRAKLSAILAASALVLSAGNVADPDLWGHVRFGQDLLAAERVSGGCSHAFTASNQPWINQEYLSQVIFAAVAAVAGPPGLLIMKALLGLGVFALIIATADRRGVSPLVIAVTILLSAYNVAPGWNVRPHIFTYAFFTLMIVILDRQFAPREAAERFSRGGPWIIPLLFIPWANLHGGFFAGFCVLGLYLLCRSAEAVWREGRGAAPQVCRHAIVVGAAGLATVLNPYGFRLHSWLLRDALQPPMNISEWVPLHVDDLRFIPFMLLLGLTAAAWLFSRAPRDATHIVLLTVTAWQSFAHVRHIPFFAILAASWLPPHLEDVRLRLRRRSSETRPAAWRVHASRTALWLTAAGLITAVAVRSRAVWVDKSMYPVAAFEFMARHRLAGRLVVQMDWAQYAIAAFAPAITVGFDLRLGCYPRPVTDMNWDFFLGASGGDGHPTRTLHRDGSEVLELGDPNLVLLNRRFGHAVDILQIEHLRARMTHVQPDWVLLYQDGLAQLWGRGRVYDDAATAIYVAPAQRWVTEEQQSGFIRWPALPAERAASEPHRSG